ncbi:NitT/TauT family transport system ATP-binding protein [Solimonas aquatica]|uniref:NitT/TauT family transport system ATP-binding protein n=1 Tax=Solimonas aquatica TaxID=489703 RepID=A0A1H9GTK4_9GAMM|nr:ABC transporter ATP-binding protein [Solimonas aquatica]SEQ53456.1 NitT/TauT family transport system ATP-binding protein [Solimonas aquatica]
MSAISVRNVWVEYGEQIVLEQIRLDIESGAFVSIVGPSGCGKTTFLKLLLGQERPTRGELLLDGAPLPDEPGADRGVVFQRYSVFPHLTVLGNVLLGPELQASPLLARLFGAKRRAQREAATQLLDAVGLGESLHKYPAQLSGGMQQRLALAQALITRPKVLLLDEPFGALDPGIRAEIHEVLKKLWKETGITIVMVTHDLREAFTLGTRVVVFDRDARRKRDAERLRYGAVITQNIEVHKRRDKNAVLSSAGRDDPTPPQAPRQDDLAPVLS